MAWDDTKSSGDLIKSADWNDMVDFIKHDSIYQVAKYYDRFLYFSCSYTDNWETYTSGSGSAALSLMLWRASTGTTSNSEARINTNSRMFNLGQDGKVGHLAYKTRSDYISDNSLGFIGISKAKMSGQTDSTLSEIHAGLFYDNGTWYASVSDGTQQKTDVTSYIPSGTFWLEMRREGDDKILFYINDTQVASFTLSSSVSIYGYFQVYANNKSLTTDEKMYLYGLLYELKY